MSFLDVIVHTTAKNLGTILPTIVQSPTLGTTSLIGDIPNSWKNSSDVSSLFLGNSVTSIGSDAFYSCTGLTGSLTLPNSLTSIGSNAFYGCSGFTGSLTFPNSLTTIGNQAFYGCSGFTGSLTFPNSLTTIGNQAFYGCSGFTGSLTLPNSLTSIGSDAFTYCTSITTVYSDVNASVVNAVAFTSSGVTIIYYQSSKTGWTNPWNGIATAVWNNYPNSIPN